MEEGQSRGDPGCASLSPPISHMQREDQKRGRGQKGDHQAQFSQSFLGAILLFYELYKEGEGNRLL